MDSQPDYTLKWRPLFSGFFLGPAGMVCLAVAVFSQSHLGAQKPDPILRPEPETRVAEPVEPTPSVDAEVQILTQPQPSSTRKMVVNAVGLEPELEAKLTAFFTQLTQKMVDEAYAGLTAGSTIAEKEDDVAKLKESTLQAMKLFGDFRGYELIEVRRVGRNLQRVTCLSLGKDLPLRWRFYFYRSGNVWRLIDMRVDDRLMDLFDEPTPDNNAK